MLTRTSLRHSRTRTARAAEFIAYCVLPRSEEPPAWVRCGHAKMNRDGSLHVHLEALPLNGELHLRPVEDLNASVSAPAVVVPLVSKVSSTND